MVNVFGLFISQTIIMMKNFYTEFTKLNCFFKLLILKTEHVNYEKLMQISDNIRDSIRIRLIETRKPTSKELDALKSTENLNFCYEYLIVPLFTQNSFFETLFR